MQVEKDVPMPNKYPFHEMEVGDSFELAPTMKRSTVTVAAQRWGQKNGGAKFTIRKTGQNTFRCWRTE